MYSRTESIFRSSFRKTCTSQRWVKTYICLITCLLSNLGPKKVNLFYLVPIFKKLPNFVPKSSEFGHSWDINNTVLSFPVILGPKLDNSILGLEPTLNYRQVMGPKITFLTHTSAGTSHFSALQHDQLLTQVIMLVLWPRAHSLVPQYWYSQVMINNVHIC